MPDFGAGPLLNQKALAAATLTFTPLANVGAIVRRISITGISASDTWLISVNGQETGRYIINSTGNQQLLGAPSTAYPKSNNIFDFLPAVGMPELIYPVGQGQVMTVSSVGGATANILIEFEEFNPGGITQALVNHPQGRHYIAPVYFSRAAAATATGEIAFDTQGGLSFLPSMFLGTNFQTGWNIRILALFLEAGGRNTFSGGANHASVTDHVAVVRNGQRLFTRTAGDGIPLVGSAAAAGSANSVFDASATVYPPFQEVNLGDYNPLPAPLIYRAGDLWQWYLGITGDVTGGATYAGNLMVALCDIQEGNL